MRVRGKGGVIQVLLLVLLGGMKLRKTTLFRDRTKLDDQVGKVTKPGYVTGDKAGKLPRRFT